MQRNKRKIFPLWNPTPETTGTHFYTVRESWDFYQLDFRPYHRLRLQWVERLWGQVDMYGRGFNEIALKEEGLCDYMFSVAIENGQYETYFTEKLLDCFATGTIPVYLGAPDIGKVFNIDGIITLSDEFYISDEVYYSKMDAIKDNLDRAKKMEVLEDYIWENYLKEKFGK